MEQRIIDFLKLFGALYIECLAAFLKRSFFWWVLGACIGEGVVSAMTPAPFDWVRVASNCLGFLLGGPIGLTLIALILPGRKYND